MVECITCDVLYGFHVLTLEYPPPIFSMRLNHFCTLELVTLTLASGVHVESDESPRKDLDSVTREESHSLDDDVEMRIYRSQIQASAESESCAKLQPSGLGSQFRKPDVLDVTVSESELIYTEADCKKRSIDATETQEEEYGKYIRDNVSDEKGIFKRTKRSSVSERDPISREKHHTGPPEETRQSFSRCLAVFTMILVSEIGDKTFFISALMSMRSSAWLVFGASFAALGVMHTLSTFLGLVLPHFISQGTTLILASGLFFTFGIKLVIEAQNMTPSISASEEMEEAEQEIEIRDSNRTMDVAEKQPVEQKQNSETYSTLSSLVSPLWIQVFVMIFLAEWGDRSQVATVALGASGHTWDVLIGGLLGHAICSAMAVAGGSILASKLSPRAITFCGALCFFTFAVLYFLDWKHGVS